MAKWLLLFLLTACIGQAAADAQDLRLKARNYRLEFTRQPKGYGIRICHGKQMLFAQNRPLQLILFSPEAVSVPCGETAYGSAYALVESTDEGIMASGKIRTPQGTTVEFEDLYEETEGGFTLRRKVEIQETQEEGKGFATAYSIGSCLPSPPPAAYEYFIPSILYRNTEEMHPQAIAADLDVERMYVKETRTGIPLAMARDTASGFQISLLHHPDIDAAGQPNGGRPGIIGNDIRFGAIGYCFSPVLSVDFRFPCAEGPRSYEPRPRNAAPTPWNGRYHKLQPGATQAYTLSIFPDRQATFQDGMQAAYLQAFAQMRPPIADICMDSIYAYNLQIFRSECRLYGTGKIRAAGLPWSLDLPDGTNREGVSFQMGFVGQQIAVGYHLLRFGLQHKDSKAKKQGEAIIDFWTSPSIMDTYFPTVWWDPANDELAGRRRNYPCFLRCMVDGMEGLLDACRTAEAYGQPHPQWEAALEKTARHLVAKQETDGSFRRAYRTDGSVETGGDRNTRGDSKLNTPVAIRFLAKMYHRTGDIDYRNAALKATEFSYTELYQKLGKYVGGTPDNPNTVDKEAAIFALYGFNAAYGLSRDKNYLRAAEHAACCAMSWAYCYDFAVPNRSEADRRRNPFAHGGTSGFSIISTGHSGADNFIAYLYYEMYKLYVTTGKDTYRDMALFLQNNTKSCTDFDGRMGYKYRAFMPEATNIADLAFRSVGLWLPWSGIANIEPIAQMEETFGESDIRRIKDNLKTLREKLAEHEERHYARPAR